VYGDAKGKGAHTTSDNGKIVVEPSSDMKFMIIKITHELSNKIKLSEVQAANKAVATGKITPQQFAQQYATIEISGNINQIIVASEIEYKYNSSSLPNFSERANANAAIEAYEKDKDVEKLKKKVVSGTVHIAQYEKLGQELREQQLAEDKYKAQMKVYEKKYGKPKKK
jgi:hypothetical protein